MSTISFNDVRDRYKKLSENQSNKIDTVFENQCRNALQSKNTNALIKCIENTKVNNNFNINTILDCFEELCEVGSSSQIIGSYNYIINEAMKKTRNAFALNNLLKHRLGRAKKKNSSKLNRKFKQAGNNIKKSLDDIRSKLSFGSKKEGFSSYECIYDDMINESLKLIHCDRILENYGSISKRFNIDKLFVENFYTNGIKDTINEFCKLIDTYDMNNSVKFNTVIESCWYGFQSNHIPIKQEDILEAASDYFLMKPDGRTICKNILEGSPIFDKDNQSIQYIVNEYYVNYEDIGRIVQESIYQYINKSDIVLNPNIRRYINEDYTFQDIFEKYKKDNEDKSKDPLKLKALVTKLYSSNIDNILDGTPNLLSWIRRIFILGTCAISPVITIVGLIADCFISIHMSRKEAQRMIECLEKEKKESEKKLNSTKVKEEKERLEEYIEALEDAIKKIEDYSDDLLTDAERDQKYDEDSDSTDSFKSAFGMDDDKEDNDDDFDDLDDFDDFGESAKFLPIICSLCEEYGKVKNEFDKALSNLKDNELIKLINDDDMKNMATFSTMFPGCLNPDSIYYPVSHFYDDIRRNETKLENSFVKYNNLSKCRDVLSILESSNNQVKDSIYIAENCYRLASEIQGMKAITDIIKFTPEKDYLLEASFTNKLKLASANLRKSIQNLSDKDKTISKNIDVTVNQLIKSAERAMTNNNREAVIKGSIIPSASKVIKMAITTTAAWIISPALAVIGLLGYIGGAKVMQNKERQKIIDEIDIELKMCEKQIEMAESKNNMKALKQLYLIQRDLQRQKQKIKYNMNLQRVSLVDPDKSEPGNNGGYHG